jgi:hypothetical protein
MEKLERMIKHDRQQDQTEVGASTKKQPRETWPRLVGRNPTPPNPSRRRLGEGGSLRRGQFYDFR